MSKSEQLWALVVYKDEHSFDLFKPFSYFPQFFSALQQAEKQPADKAVEALAKYLQLNFKEAGSFFAVSSALKFIADTLGSSAMVKYNARVKSYKHLREAIFLADSLEESERAEDAFYAELERSKSSDWALCISVADAFETALSTQGKKLALVKIADNNSSASFLNFLSANPENSFKLFCFYPPEEYEKEDYY